MNGVKIEAGRKWAAGVVFAGLFLALGVHGASAASSWWDEVVGRDVHVVAVTDMTTEGRKLRVPSRAEPTYYEALVVGYQEYGRGLKGQTEPDRDEMLKLILKLLSDQDIIRRNRDIPRNWCCRLGGAR